MKTTSPIYGDKALFTNEEDFKAIKKSLRRYIINHQFKMTRIALDWYKGNKTRDNYLRIFFYYEVEWRRYYNLLLYINKRYKIDVIESALLSGDVSLYYNALEIEGGQNNENL